MLSPCLVLLSACLALLSGLCMAAVEFVIDEEVPHDTLVGNFAERRGLAQTDNYVFTLVPVTDVYRGSNYFSLHPKTSVIRTKARIDRDTLCKHYASCCKHSNEASVDCIIPLQVLLTSERDSMSFESIQIHIKDLNDNVASWPEERRQELVYRVPENTPTGTVTALDPAEDPDVGPNGTQHYELRDTSGTFSISQQMLSSETGLGMQLMKPLDREKREIYNLTLVAFDGASPPKSGSIAVTVIVTDINDHSPRFSQTVYQKTVAENKEIHSEVLQVHAVDEDKDANGRITYKFRKRTPTSVRDLFQIDSTRGRITLIGRLDYEIIKANPWYTFIVEASDSSPEPKTATATVSIRVEDVNDCTPQFNLMRVNEGQVSRTHNRIEIPENLKIGSSAAFGSVEDCDSGSAGKAECRIEQNEYLQLQTAQGASGGNMLQIVTVREFDRDTMGGSFSVRVLCEDRGLPPRSKSYDIIVVILDKNDNEPIFDPSKSLDFPVKENVQVGHTVGRVVARDADEGKNKEVNYRIAKGLPDDAGYFRVNRISGTVTTLKPLDREHKSLLTFTVIAFDGGKPPRSSSASVIVRVVDVNDQEPRFANDHYKFMVFENQPPNTVIGEVSAFDNDEGKNARLDFAFDLRSAKEYGQRWHGLPFGVEPASGRPGVALIRTSKSIDREAMRRKVGAGNQGLDQTVYTFTLLAKDQGTPAKTASTLVTVVIKDVNDERPRWIFPKTGKTSVVNVSVNAGIGHAIGIVRAEDLDEGDHKQMIFAIKDGDPNGLFALDPQSGTLQVREKLRKVHRYQLILSATDFPNAQQNDTRFESLAMLTVNVVPSGGSGGGGSSGHNLDTMVDTSDTNVIIIVILISATAAIAVILLLIIVIMRFIVGRRMAMMVVKEEQATMRPLFPHPSGPGADMPGKPGAAPEPGAGVGAAAYYPTEQRRTSSKGRREPGDFLPPGSGTICKALCNDGSSGAVATLNRPKCNNYQVATMLRGGAPHLQPVDCGSSTEEGDSANGSAPNLTPAYQTLRPTASARLLVDPEGHYYDIVKNQWLDECTDLEADEPKMVTGGGCIDSGTAMRMKMSAGSSTPTLDLRSYLTREPGSGASASTEHLDDSSARSASTEAKFRAKQRHPIYQASFV